MLALYRWLCCGTETGKQRQIIPCRLAGVRRLRWAGGGSLLRSHARWWPACGRQTSTACTPTTTAEFAAAQQRAERRDRPLLLPLRLLLLACVVLCVAYWLTSDAAEAELAVGLPSLSTAFVPRPGVTEALHHALGACTDKQHCPLPAPSTAPHHPRSHVAVLQGTVGRGKTQLALAHAHLPRSRSAPYRLRWWIAAEQRDGLQAQYRHFAQSVGIFFNVSWDSLLSWPLSTTG